MHITTPTEPTTALWDGLLEPPVVMRSDAGLAATIGRPAQWADGVLLGDQWQPPELRALGKALTLMLVGDTSPSLDGLPPDMASAVRGQGRCIPQRIGNNE